MEQTSIYFDKVEIPVIILDTAVVGSGCAGWNAADWLFDLGRSDIALITEGVGMGTSRNTGSDKQTYYKLSLAGSDGDSIAELAETLFQGGGVNGDTALAEAAGSVRAFMKLNLLGVPFPTNAYGEFVGYKTDHDPRQRATSAGPLTSRYMTECLERTVRAKGIPVLDRMMAFQLLVWDNRIQGLLCLNLDQLDTPWHGLTLFRLRHLVLATGGPAVCYADSVYPASQTGMSGMALEAGADGANLHEWQYGLASLKFRWNVSGSYQQVLPRYISVDMDGREYEFLNDALSNPSDVLNRIFLKGYQWPFDVRKADASSWIDLMVWRERNQLGRRVFLDFRTDPCGLEHGFECLTPEAYRYLSRSDALCPTPVARLERMNPQAVELYRKHGIDLHTELLEIGVCAQHHNGGIAVDSNWQTSITGVYAVGEAAGTFGRYRPGGSALNATQVGSMRAAAHIAESSNDIELWDTESRRITGEITKEWVCRLNSVLSSGQKDALDSERLHYQTEMSRCAAHIRKRSHMRDLKRDLESALEHFFETHIAEAPNRLPVLLQNRDMMLTQAAVLDAMLHSAEEVGSSGSAYIEQEGETDENRNGFEGSAFQPPQSEPANRQLITKRKEVGFVSQFEAVRPIPEPDRWFETVWADFQAKNPTRSCELAAGGGKRDS